MNSKAVGEKSEGIILGCLLRKSVPVSIPFGNNQRYDLVVEKAEKLLKVQCKTGHTYHGCIKFNVCSINGFSYERKDYKGQVDLFMVYHPDTDKVYVVPVDEVGQNSFSLRIEAPKNNMTKGIKWAHEYTLDKWFE